MGRDRLPILLYHRVHHDDVTVPADGGRVNLSEFKHQMRRLRQRGACTVTHAGIADWLVDGTSLPCPAVEIDFDDNRLNVFENAYPVMRELGFRGTVFVITDLADGQCVFGEGDYPAMTWDHLAELRDAGWC
jgi:peptidoglycan/xylan/chitin deacetylase (PgdA/CDA1 family)